METAITTADVWEFGDNLFEGGLLSFVIRCISIFLIAYVIAKIVWRSFEKAGEKNEEQKMSLHFLGRIVRFVIYALGACAILSAIKPLAGLGTAILSATSVISVVIGLAAQESFGNFIAGFFLAMYHPFNVGDFIYLQEKDISGTVVEITFRHTEIRTVENAKLIIPNSVMNTAIVEDRLCGQDQYVKYLNLYVAHDTDLDLVSKLIYEAVLSTENVIDTRSEEQKKNNEDPFVVRIDSFDDKGMKLVFPFVTTDYNSFFNASGIMWKKLLKALKENNIQIPHDKIELIQ